MAERIPRVNQLIQEELGKILHREIEFPEDVLVTITRVEASPNLIQAKKINMRPMPKIIFVAEETTMEAARIEEILEEIKDNNE